MENAKKVADHLEFLGYKIDTNKLEDGSEIFFANHTQKNNLIFAPGGDNVVFFRVSLTANKKVSSDMIMYAHKASSDMNLCRVFVDKGEGPKEAILRLGAAFVGDYTKQAFATFYDLLELDQQRLVSYDNFRKVWL